MCSSGPRPQVAHNAHTINVVLFGEAGVGKSAVVNLIAQEAIANVSSSVDGCTMHCSRYDVAFDGFNFSIFDTVGLSQGEAAGTTSHLSAIESAYRLLVALRDAGGVHLLLFCVRGSRITMTTRSNYRLFAQFLCQNRVPVAMVVTGLEYEEGDMEDWWTRNQAAIVQKHGIQTNGHACVTTVSDGFERERARYAASQRRIRELVKSCSLKTGGFMLDPTDWLAVTGMGLRSVTAEKSRPKKKDVEKMLSRRLRMPPGDVKKILDMMDKATSPSDGGA